MSFKYHIMVAAALLSLSQGLQAATLKVATLSPEGSSWMKKFRAADKEIRTQTNNRVKFKFYPGGVMGDDNAVLRKIKIRQLQGGALTGGSLAKYYPDSQIYALPLRFNSLGEVEHVRKTIDPIVEQGFQDGGFETFGLAGGGFAYIMSKEPITHPEHLQSRKVWAPGNDNATKASFDAFDISPIPLSIGDVLAGMQTGLIDTVATSPVGAVTLQWHTQINYVTEVPIIYIYAVMAIERKAFAKLKKDDQAIVKKVMSRVFAEIDVENKQDNDKALAALAKQGIEILQPNNEEMTAWRGLGQKAVKRLVDSNVISNDMLKTLEQEMTSYQHQRFTGGSR